MGKPLLAPSVPLCGHFKIVFSRSRRKEACPDIPRCSRRESAPNPILIPKSQDGTGISTEGNEGNKVEKPLLAPSVPLCGHFKIVFSRSRRKEACPDIPRSSRREPALNLNSRKGRACCRTASVLFSRLLRLFAAISTAGFGFMGGGGRNPNTLSNIFKKIFCPLLSSAVVIVHLLSSAFTSPVRLRSVPSQTRAITPPMHTPETRQKFVEHRAPGCSRVRICCSCRSRRKEACPNPIQPCSSRRESALNQVENSLRYLRLLLFKIGFVLVPFAPLPTQLVGADGRRLSPSVWTGTLLHSTKGMKIHRHGSANTNNSYSGRLWSFLVISGHRARRAALPLPSSILNPPFSLFKMCLLRLFAASSTYLSGEARNSVADIFRLGVFGALAVQIRPRLSPLLDLCSGWAGLPLRLPTRGKFGLCKPFNACKMAGKMLDAKPRPR